MGRLKIPADGTDTAPLRLTGTQCDSTEACSLDGCRGKLLQIAISQQPDITERVIQDAGSQDDHGVGNQFDLVLPARLILIPDRQPGCLDHCGHSDS